MGARHWDGAAYLSHAATGVPASEPVTVAEAKAHANVTSATDDGLIGGLIIAAREYVEGLVKGPLIQRTHRLRLRDFPSGGALMLPAWPVSAVGSVQYMDSANALQTLASSSYSLDADGSPAYLIRAGTLTSWPVTAPQDGAWGVSIEYTAGYTSAAAVPQTLKQAILMTFAYWYDNARATATAENLREAPHAVEALCRTFARTRWSG